MSARNGDKARFGKQRKRKMAHRARTKILLEGLKPEVVAPGTPPPAHEEQHGLLGSAAESIGSALGTIAAKVKHVN